MQFLYFIFDEAPANWFVIMTKERMREMSFVPLQVTSTFSLLQSTTKIDELVTTAKERGYSAIALTDNQIMYGAVDFYNACLKQGIKPLIGLKLTFQGVTDPSQTYSVILIAKNNEGYQNLMVISTLINTSEAALTFNKIKDYLTGLFYIFPNDSELTALILNKDKEGLQKLFEILKGAANPADIYIGIDVTQSVAYRELVYKIGTDYKVSLVALPQVNYLNATDHFSIEVLRAIKDGTTITNIGELMKKLGTHWLKPAEEFESSFRDANLLEAAQNTEKIAAQSQIELKFQQPKLPQFKTEDGSSSFDYLRSKCITGLHNRLTHAPHTATDEAYKKRLEYELSVINKMGFNDYFLIIWDVIRFAHQTGITTGPGRGSAAGSLVAYVLNITDVDPLEYDLLFERFLNEERAQMPDIDLDIPDNRREEVLEYVHQKYGHNKVAQIITFGTLAAKQAIRDVGRVFGLSTPELSEWSHAIPSVLHVSLTEALDQSQKLKNMISDSSTNKMLYETACKLEGLPRHYSTHAAGIVLSDNPLVDLVPLQNGSESMMMTQYSKDIVESVGLLKMDFLGLRNLSIMADALATIKRQGDAHFKVEDVNLNDPQTLAIFARGDTNGVFQFESNGIKGVLRRLQPNNFELVAAVNALYRPGPMENIDTFIARKNGKEPVSYPDPSLAPILKHTYGIIVYQEQVMQVASKMGGFSLGQADLLRRAMSKKKKATMDAMKKRFLNGASKLGYSEKVAEQTFNYIDRFANYGFNRSHAVAYSKMAFEMAYLKVHYKTAFYAALLNSVMNNPAKTKVYLMEAKQHEVDVVAPDINNSGATFQVSKETIQFGLASIKGVRKDFLRDLLEERRSSGRFKNFYEFLKRIGNKWQKQDLIENLIYAGVFDSFDANRAELVTALPEFLSSLELSGGSMELFEELAPKVRPVPDFSLSEKLEKEEAVLGAYLSGHPVEEYRGLMKSLKSTPVSDLSLNSKCVVLVYIKRIKVIRTKRGDQMAFATVEDLTGEISVTIFPNLYRTIADWFEKEQVVVVRGKVEKQRDVQIVADQIQLASTIKVDETPTQPAGRWFLRIDADHDKPEVHQAILKVLKKYQGEFPVIFYRPEGDQTQLLNKNLWLSNSAEIQPELISILGEKNVVFQKK